MIPHAIEKDEHIEMCCMTFHIANELVTVRKRSFRRLCFYTCLSVCPQGGGKGSRPIPSREVRGFGRGGSRSMPGGGLGVWLGGSPDQGPEGLGPGLGGGVGVSQHALRQTPPSRRYASYWNAFLFLLIWPKFPDIQFQST